MLTRREVFETVRADAAGRRRKPFHLRRISPDCIENQVASPTWTPLRPCKAVRGKLARVAWEPDVWQKVVLSADFGAVGTGTMGKTVAERRTR